MPMGVSLDHMTSLADASILGFRPEGPAVYISQPIGQGDGSWVGKCHRPIGLQSNRWAGGSDSDSATDLERGLMHFQSLTGFGDASQCTSSLDCATSSSLLGDLSVRHRQRGFGCLCGQVRSQLSHRCDFVGKNADHVVVDLD